MSQRPSRPSTIYDACTGRLAAERFIPAQPRTSSTRDTATSSQVPITPKEALLCAPRAPIEYEEHDVYSAHRELPDQGRDLIPQTDLLEALHGYASDFYGAMGMAADVDWGSLDETALLALGVLMEEQVREKLGSEGDMVFVEGEDVEQENSGSLLDGDLEVDTRGGVQVGITRRKTGGNAEVGLSEELPQRFKKRSETLESRKRRKKKRKVEHEDRAGGVVGDPPKNANLGPSKASLILTHLLNTHTAHTLKDLEKTLPANIPSLHAMTVKEHLQTLINENMIRVEKIGSGNWYWVFGSEEKRRRVQEIDALKEELEKSRKTCTLLENQVKAKREAQGEGDEAERIKLAGDKEALSKEVDALSIELDGYKDNDPGVIKAMQEEMGVNRLRAQRWTDNIDVVQGWLLDKMGGDKESLEALQREVYGSEYVEGEGLAEL